MIELRWVERKVLSHPPGYFYQIMKVLQYRFLTPDSDVVGQWQDVPTVSEEWQ